MLVASSLFLCGCIGYLPKPVIVENYGTRLTRDRVAFIQPGKTTRAELIIRLGTNYVSLPHERAIAYSWETRGMSLDWYFVVAGPYGGFAEKTDCQTSAAGGAWQAYFVAFDGQELVQAADFKRLNPNNKSLHEQLDQWAAARGGVSTGLARRVPVIRLERVGEQSACWQYARLNTILTFASPSMFELLI